MKARAIGLVSTIGPDRGKADVYLDATKVATLDLYSATQTTRRIVWSRRFMGEPVSHLVELRVLGTKNAASAGRRVDFDAAVAVR